MTWIRLVVVFCVAGISYGQPPTPRAAARHLLDTASGFLPSSPTDIQVMALMHIGTSYRVFDNTKSIDFLRRAFAATAALPEEPGKNVRSAHQSKVVQAMADISLPAAIELLRSMTNPAGDFDNQTSAIGKVTQLLLGKGEFDSAIEIVNLVPEGADYPYRAAERIIARLPVNDPRRVIVFGNALAAYRRKSTGPFSEMLVRHWRELPAPLANEALDALVKSLLTRPAVANEDKATLGADGSIWVNEEAAVELASLNQVLQGLQPKLGEVLRAKNLSLRAAVAGHPDGKLPDPAPDVAPTGGFKEDDLMVPMSLLYADSLSERAEGLRRWDQVEAEALKILAAIPKDPQYAISLVPSIPFASLRADLLGRIARSMGSKDPAASKTLLGKCMAQIEEIKDSGDRIMPLVAVAEAAHEAMDNQTAWEALGKALDAVAEIYQRDGNVQRPNQALREHWPSIQLSRLLAWRTGKLFGVDAQDLLANIHEPELALVSQIEMAGALLGEPLSVFTVAVSRENPK